MPDKDDPQDESIDLNNNVEKEFKVEKKHINKIRKAVKSQGGKIGYRSPTVEKYIGKKMNVEYKKPTSPIKNKDVENSGNMKDLIDMARKGQGNINMGNKLKKRLKR
jgi:hypothetical protein